MNKIINPCQCEVFHRGEIQKVNAFCKIEIKDGCLSITGVVGPTRSNCKGSAGQCVDEIRKGTPAASWTDEMLEKFCNIWEQWHLNDMRAYCKHQKELGWKDHLYDKVKIETWTLTNESMQAKKDAEKRALKCLKEGKPFYPTKDEIAYANMKSSIKVYNDEHVSLGGLYRESYELKEKDCLGHSNTEYKDRSWIRYKDHPLGFLGRPCPVCGYEYGSSWLKEDLPQDVIDFLEGLPSTQIKPAWV